IAVNQAYNILFEHHSEESSPHLPMLPELLAQLSLKNPPAALEALTHGHYHTEEITVANKLSARRYQLHLIPLLEDETPFAVGIFTPLGRLSPATRDALMNMSYRAQEQMRELHDHIHATDLPLPQEQGNKLKSQTLALHQTVSLMGTMLETESDD